MPTDAAIIREILARECETVNQYEVLAASAQSEPIRQLVLHLAREEKEHIAECARILATLDAEYAGFLEKPLEHATASATAAPPTPPTQPAPPVLPDPTRPTLTVGNLIERLGSRK